MFLCPRARGTESLGGIISLIAVKFIADNAIMEQKFFQMII